MSLNFIMNTSLFFIVCIFFIESLSNGEKATCPKKKKNTKTKEDTDSC